MGRYKITQGEIDIAYGHDHATGFFLAVVDQRLSWSENASAAANEIAKKVNPDGGGSYFDLNTTGLGFGHKVNRATMAHFWKAYGVPVQDVQKLEKGIPF